MEWLINLFTTGGGVAHTVILYALVISLGVFLGNKIKVGGISLGVTWILFVGILAGDLLMRGNIKENTEGTLGLQVTYDDSFETVETEIAIETE